jgi:hypothetical protein
MKLFVSTLFLGGVIIFISTAVQAQNKNADPTPRTFITPQSASKVRVYEAKQRRSFGMDTQGTVRNSTQVASSGFAKSCNTTIGPSGGNQNSNSGNSGRYGTGSANKDSTVIVTGDVINVCK